MKIKKIKFIPAICLSIAFAFTSCDSGVKYSIDNPTDQAIKVIIDDKEAVTIEPNSFKSFEEELEKGKHTMQLENGEKTEINLEENSVLLNPTLTNYVKIIQEYGVGIQSSANDTTVMIGDKKYVGPIKFVSNAPVISLTDVNYDVETDYPSVVETTSRGTVTKTKIFRFADFDKFYEAEMN